MSEQTEPGSAFAPASGYATVTPLRRKLPVDAEAMYHEYGDPSGPGGADALHDAASINRPLNAGQAWWLKEAAKSHNEVAERTARSEGTKH